MKVRLSIPVMGESTSFPHPETARDDGLLAIGGDLSPMRLLNAYRQGIFPWSEDPITWWSPHPRAIFELDRIRITKSLLKRIRNGGFQITYNQAFAQVIRECAKDRAQQEETWIGRKFIKAYDDLHRAGIAHSVETWLDGKLVGGLYGVSIAGFFAGESMFHRVSDASKVAFVALTERMKRQGFTLLDSQVLSPHTKSLGAIEISRKDYLARLHEALKLKVNFA